MGAGLHIAVIRPARTLRYYPGDVLRRILYVTGFAVYAVLGIDLKAFACIAVFDNLVNTGGAVTLRGFIIQGKI